MGPCHLSGLQIPGLIATRFLRPGYALASVGSHGSGGGPRAEVTPPCDADHSVLSQRL